MILLALGVLVLLVLCCWRRPMRCHEVEGWQVVEVVRRAGERKTS